MRASHHFGPHTSLREVAERSSGVRLVLEREGLDYCCEGQRELSDACDETGARVDELLEKVEHEYRGGRDPRHAQGRRPLHSLVRLDERAHERTREMMKSLDERLAEVGASPQAVAVARAFHALRCDVESRMDREEQDVLGRLDALADAETRPGSIRAELRDLELQLRLAREHHASIGASLRRLRRASSRCGEAPGLQPICDDLRRLDRHLVHQVYLENEVLYRRALAAVVALAAPERG